MLEKASTWKYSSKSTVKKCLPAEESLLMHALQWGSGGASRWSAGMHIRCQGDSNAVWDRGNREAPDGMKLASSYVLVD